MCEQGIVGQGPLFLPAAGRLCCGPPLSSIHSWPRPKAAGADRSGLALGLTLVPSGQREWVPLSDGPECHGLESWDPGTLEGAWGDCSWGVTWWAGGGLGWVPPALALPPLSAPMGQALCAWLVVLPLDSSLLLRTPHLLCSSHNDRCRASAGSVVPSGFPPCRRGLRRQQLCPPSSPSPWLGRALPPEAGFALSS